MFANQSKFLACVSLAIAFFAASVNPAVANDQQKAEKRLRHISAMAVIGAVRGIVNQTMAETVGAKRIELMRQRHAMNLSYGSLFLAHQLTASGAQMLDIALQLQEGKNISQIANDRHANWKLIAEAAGRLSEKIDDNIYRYFLHLKADQQVAANEKYDSDKDIVRADLDFTPDELASAQANYTLWKNRGSSPRSGRLDPASETAVGESAEIYKGSQRPHESP